MIKFFEMRNIPDQDFICFDTFDLCYIHHIKQNTFIIK